MTRELKFLCAMLTLAVLALVILIARLDERTAKLSPVQDQHGEATNPIEIRKVPPTPVESELEKFFRECHEDAPEFLEQVRFHDQEGDEWLAVHRHQNEQGWNPCFTSIESVYRPVVKQLPDKKWEVIFETQDLTSEFPDP